MKLKAKRVNTLFLALPRLKAYIALFKLDFNNYTCTLFTTG